jgi:hypothetical protein
MRAARIETTVQADGELHLTRLPCRTGDRVEAIILILEDGGDSAAEQQKREEARQRFLRACQSLSVSFHRSLSFSRGTP